MITAETSGLLIIDVQGKLAELVSNSQSMMTNISKLVKSCEILSIPIVILEQNPHGLGPTAPAIKNSVQSFNPIEKHSFNALDEEHIKSRIQTLNKQNWLVAGIEAHICVYQTVKGLLGEGFSVEVVADCISSRHQPCIQLAIENMRRVGANITTLEMAMFEVMKSSKNEYFRDVLNIIK
ncbi:isochorismatase family protein [Alteromonas sp. ASW11-130]|uniref:isochorismatase family protein n=1 Tax=Alteromonas sp. ASW11-130 TaxID=3015775 RepID=UPI002241CA65|nr:isochorismatase family protein [Alteromonas sp. ASW11-130]